MNGVDSRAYVKWTVFSKHFSKKKKILVNELASGGSFPDKTDESGMKNENKVKGKVDKDEGSGFCESFDDISKKGRMVYGIRYQIFYLLRGLLCAIHVRELSCELDYGLPDPADTGMLCGYLYTLASVVHSGCRMFRYSINPWFSEEHLDVRMDGDIRFRVVSLFYPLLKFILSMKVLRTCLRLVRNRGSSSSGVSV
ncbi:MAG: DUF2953 domain-containing protein [Halobacteriota archaeon]